jgi:hypothetical protein
MTFSFHRCALLEGEPVGAEDFAPCLDCKIIAVRRTRAIGKMAEEG